LILDIRICLGFRYSDFEFEKVDQIFKHFTTLNDQNTIKIERGYVYGIELDTERA
jgi:hypothetical protein